MVSVFDKSRHMQYPYLPGACVHAFPVLLLGKYTKFIFTNTGLV
jgi:hypothetical protein